MAHIRQARLDSGLGFQVKILDRLRVAERGTMRAEDVQGTPIQSDISPRLLEYEDITLKGVPSSLGSGLILPSPCRRRAVHANVPHAFAPDLLHWTPWGKL